MASLKPEKPAAGSVSLGSAKKEPVKAPVSKQGVGAPKGAEAQRPREPRKKASGAKPGAKK